MKMCAGAAAPLGRRVRRSPKRARASRVSVGTLRKQGSTGAERWKRWVEALGAVAAAWRTSEDACIIDLGMFDRSRGR